MGVGDSLGVGGAVVVGGAELVVAGGLIAWLEVLVVEHAAAVRIRAASAAMRRTEPKVFQGVLTVPA